MKLGTYLIDCASRYPDKTAYVCGADRVSFSALAHRATVLAHALLSRNVRLGDRVGVYMGNSGAVVETMAAIAMIGAVVVPISTRLAPDEVHFILEDADVSHIFFDASLRCTVDQAHTRLHFQNRVAIGAAEPEEDCFATLLQETVGTHQSLPRLPIDPDDLVIGYTSGTTGTPKGAIGTHRAMIMASGYMSTIEFRMNADDRVLITSPMAHRVGLARTIGMLCVANTAIIMPRFDPKQAVDLIAREQVTVISVVPTIARLLVPELEQRADECGSLKKLLATGEAFPAALKERLWRALPHLELYTSYAQTEGGLMTCLRPEEQRDFIDSVGRPLPGVEFRLVDERGMDVDPERPGEAWVRFGQPGESMSLRAYHKRPEATSEVLTEDGWLKTGDVLRADEKGYLYFVDRAKDMIVSGGLNIYAKEVELCLIQHPDVADAAVIGIADNEFGEAVCAYIELEAQREVDSESIIEHCKRLIASYKKPKVIRFTDSLPRTLSGKVRKGVLRQWEAERVRANLS